MTKNATPYLTLFFSAALLVVLSQVYNMVLESLTPGFSNPYPVVQINGYQYSEAYDSLQEVGSGSGTVISSEGHIITNHHVVYRDDINKPLDAFEVCYTYNVIYDPSCIFTADLIAADEKNDVAILKMDSKDIDGDRSDFEIMEMSQRSRPSIGDEILLIGYPDIGNGTITVSQGLISGYTEESTGIWAKIDSKSSFGSSGGAIIDESGELIGIQSYNSTSDIESLAYMKPLSEVASFVEDSLDKEPLLNELSKKKLLQILTQKKSAWDTKIYTHDDPKITVNIPEGWGYADVNVSHSDYIAFEHEEYPITLTIDILEYGFNIDEQTLSKEVKRMMDDDLVLYKYLSPTEYTFISSQGYGEGKLMVSQNYGFDVYWSSSIGKPDQDTLSLWKDSTTLLTQGIDISEVDEKESHSQITHGDSLLKMSTIPGWKINIKNNDAKQVEFVKEDSDLRVNVWHSDLSEKAQEAPELLFKDNVTGYINDSQEGFINDNPKLSTLFGKPAYTADVSFKIGRSDYRTKWWTIYDEASQQEIDIYIESTPSSFVTDLIAAENLIQNWNFTKKIE